MKYKQIIFFFITLTFSNFSFGQISPIIITPQIKLPNDSLTKQKLLKSLNIFLQDKNNNLINSVVIDSIHYKKFKDYFDMFKNIEKSKKYNDDNFFKCYLKNVVLQPDKSYKIDLSYYGITKESEVINRLNISINAIEDKDKYVFYCPFERNTQHWKYSKIGNIDFYYQDKLNKVVAMDFDNYNTTLAKKLKIRPLSFKFYNCKDVQEVYKIFGIDYDISQNGNVRSGSFDVDNGLFVAGTNSEQYKHDLTHTYFSLKFPDSLRNWTAEEGYNIYNNDYWGETSTQIFSYLKAYISINKDTSLYKAFISNYDLKKPISIKYPLSALLLRKVEREFGFEKVLEIISCGETDDKFLAKLGQLIGLTEDNFDKIIKDELKR